MTKAKSNIDEYIDLLGRRARDKISGFEGTIASVGFDLYGCIQVVLTPKVDKDGKSQDSHWYDVHRIELLPGERAMDPPIFGLPVVFAKEPAKHAHGPAEKPRR